ncbi:MAG: glycerate kinase, partial [Elusimicrobiaceae bacterium]|nr:glycerate kinase [Elusimicrobiaceae bacterium]
MNILVLPNSLKGSLSARQTARLLQTALGKKHRVKAFPLSDGGDG